MAEIVNRVVEAVTPDFFELPSLGGMLLLSQVPVEEVEATKVVEEEALVVRVEDLLAEPVAVVLEEAEAVEELRRLVVRLDLGVERPLAVS